MTPVAVYIPIKNGEAWCAGLRLQPGLSYVAFDNASTDGSADLLRARGVEVITHPRDIGRIGNWSACVEHFVRSGKPWMKWLFAGDSLGDDFAAVASRAIAAYPEARMIVGDYMHIGQTVRSRVQLMQSARLFEPIESLRLAAGSGNWFHAPVNQMFHRDALADGVDYGPFVWGADFYFCINVASQHQVGYWPEVFGSFHETSRAHFLNSGQSIQALLEVSWVRQIAAARLKALTGDSEEFERLSANVEDSALRRLIAHVASRGVAGRTLLAGWRAMRRTFRSRGR